MATFTLAALKGQQLLQQWKLEAVYKSPEVLAMEYWPSAKAVGADRLCVAKLGSAWFACYDGKGLTPQKLSLPVPPPPAPKCPPGQVFDAAGKCVTVTPGHPGYPPRYPGPKISPWHSSPAKQPCQPGYHYDAHAGRCVPNFSLLAGVRQFSGSVRWLGESGSVGLTKSGIEVAKGLLYCWSLGAGKDIAQGLPGDAYGPADVTRTDQNARDRWMLVAFRNWWNGGKNQPPITTASKDLDDAYYAALITQSSKYENGSCTGCSVSQKLNPVTGKCEEQSSWPKSIATPGGQASPGLPQQGGPQTTQPPQYGSKEGVVECDGKTPCAAGLVCIGGKCQPLPAKPAETPSKKSGSGWLIVGAIGVAIVGGLAVMAGGKKPLAMNPARWPEPDLDLTPLSVGFDPRRHDMTCALPATARRVRYDVGGETREVSGTTKKITAALRAAGYRIKVTA